MRLFILIAMLGLVACSSTRKVIVENCERVVNSEKWVCEL